ncbi:TTAGGG repeat binding factor [Coemansia erecta]|uniref:TTAGGG repeat binding factor n=1 Tax=Coemansia erecta TaxID=147472 RepID=A0A9W7Y2D0_9FUNG|nr:TTAGGG repeat binding factor [Coemansia erecta]
MARPPGRRTPAKAAPKKTLKRRRVNPNYGGSASRGNGEGSENRNKADARPPQTAARRDPGRQPKSTSGTQVWKHAPIKPLNLTTKKARLEVATPQKQEQGQESESAPSADTPKASEEVMSPQRRVAKSIIRIIHSGDATRPEHSGAVVGEIPAGVAAAAAVQKTQASSKYNDDEGPPSSIGVCSDSGTDSSDSSNSSDSDDEDTEESNDDIDQAHTPNKSSANDGRSNEATTGSGPSQNEMGKDSSMPETLESIPMATIGADNESYSADLDTVRNAKPIVSNTQNGAEDSGSDSSSDSNSGEEDDGADSDASDSEDRDDDDGDDGNADGSSGDKATPPVEQIDQNAPILGPGTASDLMILDYVSHQILHEVAEFSMLFEKSANDRDADVLAKLKRIEHLAYEQALMRKQRFTRSLYLQNDQRPGFDFDMFQWGTSMLRINQATFALLILCPEAIIDDKIDRKLPNHDRLLASAGFKAAADGLFEHVVPTSKRDGNTVNLLVDIQTQQWLAGADDEKQLKSVLDQVRELDDVAIGQLLSIDDAYDSMQAFDRTAISVYRGNVNQRLNKLSGRRLNTTRSHYALEGVQRRVASFIGECAEMMSPPVISTIASSQQPSMDDSFIVDSAREESEVEDDEMQTTIHTQDAHANEHASSEVPTTDAAEAQENGDSQISGEYEVTILKSKAELQRIRVLSDRASTNGAASVVPRTPIDQTFSETRRVASVMRDVARDAHLDELLETIDHEEIDISKADTPETHARMQLRSRAPSPPHTVPDISAPGRRDSSVEAEDNFRPSMGDDILSDDDDNDNVPSESRNGSLKALSERRDEVQQASTRRLRARPSTTRSYVDIRDSDGEDLGAEEDMIRAIQRPTKRTRVQYSHPSDHGTPRSSSRFRGRRGIAAEDPATFEDEDDSIRFTPSIQGSPSPQEQQQQHDEFELRKPYMSPGSQLGQYKPGIMVRDEMVQTPPMRGRRTRSAGSTTPKPRLGRRQIRKRWTNEEEACFISAVHKYGLRWSLILSFHGKYGSVNHILKDRTREHLKDKARNIKIRLQRENRPLGPFEYATGGA